jgi:hypothetical protein
MPAVIPVAAMAGAGALGASATGVAIAGAAGSALASSMSKSGSGGGGGGSVPSPESVSQADAAAAAETARLNARLNRYNQTTPYGNLTWSQDPNDPDIWSSNVALSPEQQAIYDQISKNQLHSANLWDTVGGQATGLLGQGIQAPTSPLPNSSDATRQRIEDALYQRMTSRLDPQFSQRQGDLESRLVNQGINIGTEAWDREAQNLAMDRTDAYQTAMDAAIAAGGNEASRQNALEWGDRQNYLAEQSGMRNQLLNELASLSSGSQVTNPQFQGQQTGVNVASTPTSSNYWNAYQANQAQQNANTNSQNTLMQGLFGLGSAYLSGGGGFGSSGGLFGGGAVTPYTTGGGQRLGT